ncbi:Mitochondrial carrier protein [Neofusicoccum parvum]|uniref:Mitochondrial thiamine pyrophosphate carrier 1 n=2 Tax=Neofusicoccum parvum TaxID=310453 RepID=R1EH58_BOTPV|nr:putative mitochondrial carrier protein leu5 protein [Neofusicoccum parvum UCRNP2]GME23045.1 Mitochondrial carrier protein [Neofusicoccum parvum]GME50905.1 Mitochondrial carrier protein [Neofusicoccum parvum]
MTAVHADSRSGRGPAICPTDDDAIVPRKPAAQRANRKLDKTSWEYIIKSGVAGGFAGCAAKTLVGPLDRVKILFQTSNPQFAKYTGSWAGVAIALRDIYQQNGMRGWFKGHSATLLRIFPYAGIKFLAYEQIRNMVIKNKEQETPVRRFISGSMAGTVSVFFTYPLEVIRVRLAFETRQGSRSTLTGICKKIYHETAPAVEPANNIVGRSTAARTVVAPVAAAASTVQKVTVRGGLGNFFRGFTPTMWGMLPYAGCSFLTHDTVSDLLRHPRIAAYTTIPRTERATGEGRGSHKPAQLQYWAELTSGGMAGFVSQTVSYPLEIIRRRMQVGGVVGDGHRLGMIEVAQKIFMERGLRGFFVGLTIGYVKVIPMAATSFFAYERGKYYLGI